MKNNPLKKLESLGQSIWLDYIRRDLITSGELLQLIENDGIRGITSNPAIFEKAIADSNLYDDEIKKMALAGQDVNAIYESISQKDVQSAADVFNPLYKKTSGKDGFVSLEVNPHLAHNTSGTIEEGKRLWALLNRPNVLIKVPATTEGLVAIQKLISEGINVNVTLLFGLPRYREVAEAYIRGLEERVAMGKPIDQITSVASFFLSRIDSLIDSTIEKQMESDDKKKEMVKEVQGKIAISSARLAYNIYKETFGNERFKKLEEKGAQAQRLLWASTSNKNPNYSDIKYIEALIGENTVNTAPPKTIDAYRDHGDPKLRIELDVINANQLLASLPQFEIDIDQVTQQLEDEGVSKFNEPFDKLLEALAQKSS